MLNLSEPVRHLPEVRSFEDWNKLELIRRARRLRKMYTIHDPQLRKNVLNADYQACKENPQYWIENYGWLANPQEDKESIREFPFVMFNQQIALLELLNKSLKLGHPVLCNKGRELGISWLMLYRIFHAWRFSKLFSAKLGSRKESLVDDSTMDSLFGKLRFILDKQPPHLKEKNIKDIYLQIINNRNNSEIIGEATNTGFGRGGRKTVVMLDEYAHNLPAIADSIWKSIDSVTKCAWLPSSPNGKGNKFYFLYSSFPQEYTFEIKWEANPYRDKAWKDNKLLTLTEDEFEQEHGASFSAIRVGKIFKSQRDASSYGETDSEWLIIKDEARRLWPHVGGWDFGSGPSLTCCLFSILQYFPNDPIPCIWLDDELAWKSAGYDTVATDANLRLSQYGSSFRIHFGDPAGKNRESDQSSWIDNLANCGIPITQCEQSVFNTQVGIDTNVKLVQNFLDSRKLRIHERCRLTWEAIEQWRYNIPEGIPIDNIDKAWIAPKKDGYSHPANALLYLVGGVVRYLLKPQNEDLSELKKSSLSLGGNTLSKTLGIARTVC